EHAAARGRQAALQALPPEREADRVHPLAEVIGHHQAGLDLRPVGRRRPRGAALREVARRVIVVAGYAAEVRAVELTSVTGSDLGASHGEAPVGQRREEVAATAR